MGCVAATILVATFATAADVGDITVMPLSKTQIVNHSTTNTFGNTRLNRRHDGWDLYAKEGTPVHSIASGFVTKVHNDPEGYGLYVDVEYAFRGKSIVARYAHLNKVNVKEGSLVQTWQVIGKTGVSGNSSKENPHLHFEIRINGVPNSPMELWGNYYTTMMRGTIQTDCTVQKIGTSCVVTMSCN